MPGTPPTSSGPVKVALTGGPGAGKTTAADLLRREVGERVVVVPETATMLFGGGFPRGHEPVARCAAQTAIFQVQRAIEDVYAATYPDRILLCDRGTVDGAVYWPESTDAFFRAQGTTLQAELARYDRVIFFETAARGGLAIEGGNPVRTENLEQAVALDLDLEVLWSQHPRFTRISHDTSFLRKIFSSLEILTSFVNHRGAPH